MVNDKATFMIVVISISTLLGAFFGGLTAYFVVEQAGLVEEVADQFGVELSLEDDSDEDLDDQIIKLIEEETVTISVVEQVVPAVVSVLSKREFSGELVEVGGGTGFFVTEDGLLLTNKHVVESDQMSYSVLTNDGIEYPVEVIARDTLYDIAVLQVVFEEGESGEAGPGSAGEISFPTAELGDSDQIQNGQTVIAIGNALSEYQNSVTKGVISGTDRRVVAGNFYSSEVIEGAIQTDAAINPGNSGGPLINLFGQVIGVNTAISSAGEGLGFAIPINLAVKVVNDVVEYGHIIRPWIGVRYVMIDEYMAEENELDSDHGALVVSGRDLTDYAIVPGSPADLAGLKEGDIIVAINNEEIEEDNTLSKIVNQYMPEDVVVLTVARSGETTEIQVTLAEMDSSYLE